MTDLNRKMELALTEATRCKKQADALRGKADRESWWQARRKYLLAQARVWELCNR